MLLIVRHTVAEVLNLLLVVLASYRYSWSRSLVTLLVGCYLWEGLRQT